MAAPGKYVVSYSFSGFQATQPDRPLPAPRHDTEYYNIAHALGETIDALGDIRRDDGHLENGIVDVDALDPAVLAEIEADADRAEAAADEAEAWAQASQLVIVADEAPAPVPYGKLWWDSGGNGGGQLFLYYDDGSSAQWVQIVGTRGDTGATGDTGPPAPSYLRWAAGDETTPISAGSAKVTDRMPYAFTATGIKASLNVAQVGGALFTVDVKWWNGASFVTVLSTLLTFDNGEATSMTAAAQPVLSKTAFADDDLIRIDVTQIGDGTAAGLKLTLLGSKA